MTSTSWHNFANADMPSVIDHHATEEVSTNLGDDDSNNNATASATTQSATLYLGLWCLVLYVSHWEWFCEAQLGPSCKVCEFPNPPSLRNQLRTRIAFSYPWAQAPSASQAKTTSAWTATAQQRSMRLVHKVDARNSAWRMILALAMSTERLKRGARFGTYQ
eukprot:CAMPEP_0172876744 /NCGR_PEP_ID=MMETSP1075-20121228/105169_1 /TAXON_ID=2916 /ORGANISM="Ceratium fusus, Strain PA161109" /LENGTH=161 /DNA_ID=CAMNT_0013728147 /DNA_START=17 /DNA_END=503 /DNA_ORIENTATION=+